MEVCLIVVWLVIIATVRLYIKIDSYLKKMPPLSYVLFSCLFLSLGIWGTIHTLILFCINSFKTTKGTHLVSNISCILLTLALFSIWRLIINDEIENSANKNPPH